MLYLRIFSYFLGWFGRVFVGSVLFFLIIAVAGCGFQLNRNKLQLLDQAKSISISKIENKSFIPRLDIRLKALLIEKFNTNLISIKSVSQADLVLSFVIRSYNLKQSDYSLDETGQTYDFQFSVNGELTVYDNRTQKFFLTSDIVKSSHSVITQVADLTTIEIDEAREDLLDSLSQAMAEKLTDSF